MNNVNELEISYNVGINSQTAKISCPDGMGGIKRIELNEQELKFLLQSLLRNVKFEIK